MFDFTGINRIDPGFDNPNYKNSKTEIEIKYIPSDNKKESKPVDDVPSIEKVKTISDRDFNRLFQPVNDNSITSHAKQEFSETEKAMDELDKSVNELSEQINGLSNDMANISEKTSTEKSSEEVDHVHKVFNDMLENKKKEDPEFKDKVKETVKQVKETVEPDENNKEVAEDNSTTKLLKKYLKNNTVYGRMRLFIESSDFIPAFLWFMENAYNNVKISHMHRRRIYKIYKEMISGSNLFAICVKDEDADTYDCEFILDGSNKAIINFMNNKKSKYAKILARYIITSNTIPYMLQLMSFDNKADADCFNALPTRVSSIRSMSKSEVYTRTLEKICFGKDF